MQSFVGVEVDMMSLGDADSILFTRWNTSSDATRVLIDGGNPSDSEKVGSFLLSRGVQRLDYLVCSHLDQDHVGGLIGLVTSDDFEITEAWVHRPELHVDVAEFKSFVARLSLPDIVRVEHERVTKSLKQIQSLLEALDARKIPVREPFEGEHIGDMLDICGPSREYYEKVLSEFKNVDSLRSMSSALFAQKSAEESDTLQSSPQTTPENNSSTVLTTPDRTMLFCADAGKEALEGVLSNYSFDNLVWAQVPHHGSVNNVTSGIIQRIAASGVFVSAGDPPIHPSTAVVSEYKKRGAQVYSTHKSGNLLHHKGQTPSRPGYSPATPL